MLFPTVLLAISTAASATVLMERGPEFAQAIPLVARDAPDGTIPALLVSYQNHHPGAVLNSRADVCNPGYFACSDGGCCPNGYDCGTYGGVPGCCPTGKTCSGVGGCPKSTDVECSDGGCCSAAQVCCTDDLGEPKCCPGGGGGGGGSPTSTDAGSEPTSTSTTSPDDDTFTTTSTKTTKKSSSTQTSGSGGGSSSGSSGSSNDGGFDKGAGQRVGLTWLAIALPALGAVLAL